MSTHNDQMDLQRLLADALIDAEVMPGKSMVDRATASMFAQGLVERIIEAGWDKTQQPAKV